MNGDATNPIPFVASSVEEAVAQIRGRLGAEAIVVNVRRLPVGGLARLWQKPMIEVLAYGPEPSPAPALAAAAPQLSDALAEFREELDQIKQQVGNGSGWRVAPLLQKTGVLPVHVQTILDALQAAHGASPPPSLGAELARVRGVLQERWRAPLPLEERSLHVLVGPPGSGKTTCLCKWLTQTALVEGRMARVWRLDSAIANTAEALSVYCEILNVPSERTWQPGAGNIAEDIAFVDLPGVDWRNPAALQDFAKQLPQHKSNRLHLVLNAAYDTSILLAQVRAFSTLPIADIVLTHLDEETRWGKIWNLALGTAYPIRFLSAGHNIPGDFSPATADKILSRQFERN
jgi:flagellar biosynthesis protein FlhF